MAKAEKQELKSEVKAPVRGVYIAGLGVLAEIIDVGVPEGGGPPMCIVRYQDGVLEAKHMSDVVAAWRLWKAGTTLADVSGTTARGPSHVRKEGA